MPPHAQSPRPRQLDRIAFAVIAVLGFLAAVGPVTTNDLFWHVATGEHLYRLREFPALDVFSYTANDLPWFLHEWLTQVIFFGLHELGGLHALRLFTGLMSVAILFLVWRTAKQHLTNPVAGVVVLLAFAVLGTCRFQARPTLFSIAFFLGLIAWLGSHRGPWRLRHAATLVLCVVVWVNLHSVGLLGLTVYGAFATGHVARAWLAREPVASHVLRHALTFAVATGASCLNPAGWHLFDFAFQDKSEVMNFLVDEWGAFQFAFADNPLLTFEAYVVVLGILATVVITYLLTGIALNSQSERRSSPALPDPVHLALLALCLAGGLMARRFHWMLAISLLFAMSHLATLIRHGILLRVLRLAPLRIAGIVTAVTLFVLHYNRDLRHENQPLHEALLTADYYTRQIAPSLDLPAVQFMRDAGLEGNAFCHYGSGGMLTYFLYPKVKVFVDSRADLYRRRILLEFMAVRDGHPDQQEILDQHGTDIYFRHWEIAALRAPSGWTKVYEGPDGEVWLRKHDRNLENLKRCKAWHRRFGPQSAPR